MLMEPANNLVEISSVKFFINPMAGDFGGF